MVASAIFTQEENLVELCYLFLLKEYQIKGSMFVLIIDVGTPDCGDTFLPLMHLFLFNFNFWCICKRDFYKLCTFFAVDQIQLQCYQSWSMRLRIEEHWITLDKYSFIFPHQNLQSISFANTSLNFLTGHFRHVTKNRIFKNLNLRKKADRNFCRTFVKNRFRHLKLYSNSQSWLARGCCHMGTSSKTKDLSSHFWDDQPFRFWYVEFHRQRRLKSTKTGISS